MPRPTDKASLQHLAEQNYQKLYHMIDSLSAEQQLGLFPFDDRDKNIRDVLIHLYEWHQLLIHWVENNLAGHDVAFLPAPFNWKTYPQMNVEFWQKHQSTPLETARADFEKSHHKAMQLIEPLNDEQLFTKKFYKFTGSTNLASYVISATSSHYDWALKKISKYCKMLNVK
ncbi:ClbS/DfsB family four-helix bundle protein [Bartonella sp. HY406]|uniref:ClbS/DfsB family four-helix bundle protein n=1 Tax=Bartonella sp. HY406 TaxID=2979331 RepID=UPI0021C81474|nr:ClbS/DfsB family four-helix bundle protein [Bartonella sp. HY406]UXN04167.1 ClbS/DfsB family four-helix bundle protein [Bartonella sp. HY406]